MAESDKSLPSPRFKLIDKGLRGGGVLLFLDDKALDHVQNLSYNISAEDHIGRLTIQFIGVPIEIEKDLRTIGELKECEMKISPQTKKIKRSKILGGLK